MALLGPTGRIGEATAGPVEPGCEIVEDHFDVDLQPDPHDAYSPFTPSPVAVSAWWDVLPRRVTALATDSAVYLEIVAELLASLGVAVDAPVITQILAADLDGDGSDEVVIVADNHQGEFLRSGVYSVVFVREVVGDRVETTLLHESILLDVVEGEIPFTETAQVSAIADLDGDGGLEIVIGTAYYEGVAAHLWDDQGNGFVEVLSTGCGA